MQRQVTLSAKEIETAIIRYVEQEAGFSAGSVSLAFHKGDRPFDPDTWTATATESRTQARN